VIRYKLGKFLVVSTFVARRLQVQKNARNPSGEIWNYLSRRMSVALQKLSLLRHLVICFWLQIYDKWATPNIKLSVTNVYSKHELQQATYKE